MLSQMAISSVGAAGLARRDGRGIMLSYQASPLHRVTRNRPAACSKSCYGPVMLTFTDFVQAVYEELTMRGPDPIPEEREDGAAWRLPGALVVIEPRGWRAAEVILRTEAGEVHPLREQCDDQGVRVFADFICARLPAVD